RARALRPQRHCRRCCAALRSRIGGNDRYRKGCGSPGRSALSPRRWPPARAGAGSGAPVARLARRREHPARQAIARFATTWQRGACPEGGQSLRLARHEACSTDEHMKLPRQFFMPLAIGAPAPLLELPVRLERMIHFIPPHLEKLTAKVPE